jgi:serine/threonine-protein kinase
MNPNFFTVYDVGVDADMPYIVMECLSGATLADEIAHGPMAPARTVDVMRHILDGLGAAHERGVLHRDLKPANVLVADEGRMKLADFGIAWSEDRAELTATGLVLGTPSYLAPERIEGEPATVRSDLYSVGVMTYEALAGVRPFTGRSPVAVAYSARHGAVRPLRTLRPDVSRALAEVVSRAMAPLPEHRYASAADMATALEQSLDDLADDTTRVLPIAGWKAPRRHRVRTPVLGVVALSALLIGGIAASTRVSHPSPPRAPVNASTRTLPPELRAPFEELQQAVGK